MIRYAKLLLPYDVKAIQNELLFAGDEWQPHINTYHYTGSWTVLAVRSPGGDHKNITPELMGKHNEYQDNVYLERFPSVKQLLQCIECPVMAARFLNLQAGAVIKEHRDNELAFEKGEARLHFPVFTNPGVEFFSEHERIFLLEGECWYLNANLPHRVTNNGGTDRIHLVIDCKVNDWLKDLITLSETIAFKKETVNKRDLSQMIEYLRNQNTDTANTLAGKLEQQLREANDDSSVI